MKGNLITLLVLIVTRHKKELKGEVGIAPKAIYCKFSSVIIRHHEKYCVNTDDGSITVSENNDEKMKNQYHFPSKRRPR